MRLLVCFGIFITTLTADILQVPADYQTIQQGLDAASRGDSIMVQPGTYYENIIWPESLALNLFGSGSHNCVIDGLNSNSVIQIANSIDSISTLKGFRIQHGDAVYGGGINCTDASLFLEDISITNNRAEIGGGVYCGGNSTLLFSPGSLCNIYDNSTGQNSWGMDIHSDIPLEVYVDTFTVSEPTEMFVYPKRIIEVWSQNSSQVQIDADLYVSDSGEDSNSGLSPTEPLKTIRQAFRLSAPDEHDPNTIYLLDGVYSPSTNGESFPVNILYGMYLKGESRSGVRLDAENQGSVLRFNHAGSSRVSTMTLTGGSAGIGGGIYCEASQPILTDMYVIENSASFGGGGMSCSESHPQLSEMVFFNNEAPQGGAIICSYTHLSLDRVSLVQNFATETGGGIYGTSLTSLSITNSILWSNTNANVALAGGSDASSLDVSYSTLEGGEAAVQNGSGYVLWGPGNIITDPLFVSIEEGNVNLTNSSPCIDTGDPTSTLDPDSTRADMGAIYFHQSMVALMDKKYFPVSAQLIQNHPNPFNPSTTIRYGIPNHSPVSLVIFDIRGHEVKSIEVQDKPAGWHEYVWNGRNQNQQPVSTGVYLARLTTPTFSETIKLIYLK